jgi:hypothetical protein
MDGLIAEGPSAGLAGRLTALFPIHRLVGDPEQAFFE